MAPVLLNENPKAADPKDEKLMYVLLYWSLNKMKVVHFWITMTGVWCVFYKYKYGQATIVEILQVQAKY